MIMLDYSIFQGSSFHPTAITKLKIKYIKSTVKLHFTIIIMDSDPTNANPIKRNMWKFINVSYYISSCHYSKYHI